MSENIKDPANKQATKDEVSVFVSSSSEIEIVEYIMWLQRIIKLRNETINVVMADKLPTLEEHCQRHKR